MLCKCQWASWGHSSCMVLVIWVSLLLSNRNGFWYILQHSRTEEGRSTWSFLRSDPSAATLQIYKHSQALKHLWLVFLICKIEIWLNKTWRELIHSVDTSLCLCIFFLKWILLSVKLNGNLNERNNPFVENNPNFLWVQYHSIVYKS